MRKKQLGMNGPEVSVVCFGTFPIGGGFGSVPKTQAIKTVHAALDAGIDFIDTAEGYNDAEEILGEALSNRRDEVFLATKISRKNHSAKNIDEAIENSLKKLKTDYIDLYQIHGPQPNYPIEDTLERFIHHRDLGNIRYFGISNFTPTQTIEAAKYTRIHSSQPRYNILFRDVEDELLPVTLDNGIGAIAHSVMAKGLLAGKYLPGHKFSSDDQRDSWEYYNGSESENIFEVTFKLKEWSESKGHELSELAIAWPTAHEVVTSSIVGFKKPEQAILNARAGDWELTKSDLAEIEDILNGFRLHFSHGSLNPDYVGFRDKGDR